LILQGPVQKAERPIYASPERPQPYASILKSFGGMRIIHLSNGEMSAAPCLQDIGKPSNHGALRVGCHAEALGSRVAELWRLG
jgi:hypothetical protein